MFTYICFVVCVCARTCMLETWPKKWCHIFQNHPVHKYEVIIPFYFLYKYVNPLYDNVCTFCLYIYCC